MTSLRRFLTAPGLLRLLSVRLGSQVTDGLFQAALGGAILFNPERHSDPLAVAGGFAVLLLPYSFIGPFAGALLDHWARRTVLIWANVFRALSITLVAVAVATGCGDSVVLLLALVVTGASRFVASGLSAALPHVIERERLVGTNAFFTTIGAVALAVGAGLAVAFRAMFGADNVGSALTISTGMVLALLAAALANGFERFRLGPDEPDESTHTAVHAVAVGLLHGARAAWRAPSVVSALSAIGAHRLVFGLNTLMLLVLTKHSTLGGGGLTGISLVAALTAGGLFLAAVITPLSVNRIGRQRTLLVALGVGVVAETSLVTLDSVVICVSALVLGLIGQIAKLCGDAAMQMDVDDTHRGQVFSFQDAVFNVAYVAAITCAALTIAPDGRSPGLPALGAVLYAIGMVVVVLCGRRVVDRVDTPRGTVARLS
ncbi:MFS transporter [Williamsia sterculiae]|uniref:Predicted arabinose efflux permease, MFS family n=1 Tax=Williamsia sterculiae TaxID=1344003 RepID=A0A1N7FGJ5_9NOCA|nr:MFS transporter [Williamsia sterculiae]SIR99461.1 Predicted arabinose efflux permease, MFS family [Williamsia sterculiae]